MIHEFHEFHELIEVSDTVIWMFSLSDSGPLTLAEEFEFPLCTLAVAAWILPDLISELRAMQPAPGCGVFVSPGCPQVSFFFGCESL